MNTLPSTLPVFSAVITPNLSLDTKGSRLVLGLVALANLWLAGMFWASGAWPILPFLGLDMLLVWAAFRAYRRKASAYEEVCVTPEELVVRQVPPAGRGAKEHRFNPSWVRLSRHVVEDEGLVRLALTSHGRSLVIARFLSPGEREHFATALENALDRARRMSRG